MPEGEEPYPHWEDGFKFIQEQLNRISQQAYRNGEALKARVAELEGNLTIKDLPDSEGMWWWRGGPADRWQPRIVSMTGGGLRELDPDWPCQEVGTYESAWREAWEPLTPGQWYGPIPEPPKPEGEDA